MTRFIKRKILPGDGRSFAFFGGLDGSNAIEKVKLNLCYSNNPYMKILFMGHRGSEKSTELYRLKEQIKSEYEVINFFRRRDRSGQSELH